MTREDYAAVMLFLLYEDAIASKNISRFPEAAVPEKNAELEYWQGVLSYTHEMIVIANRAFLRSNSDIGEAK